jgi:hypothetical protein
MSRRRLGIIVTRPIQYQAPLYRYITARSTVEPVVFFRVLEREGNRGVVWGHRSIRSSVFPRSVVGALNEAMAAGAVPVVSDPVGCAPPIWSRRVWAAGYIRQATSMPSPLLSQQLSRWPTSADSGQGRSNDRRSTVSPPLAAASRRQCRSAKSVTR